MDHDQRFKELIRAFFAEFLRLFFAAWAARLEPESVEWLQQEVYPDPPEGPRRVLDLVAKVRTRLPVEGSRELVAAVHIEVESGDAAAPLRPRLYRMRNHLRDRTGLPVLPLALYLKVGLNGVGIDSYAESFWELEVVRFQYLYVGLPALDGLQYVEGGNPLGVALSALMRIPPERAAWLGAEALRKIGESGLPDQKKFLLAECVEAYLPLDEAQRAVYEQLVRGTPAEGLKAMNETTYDKGMKEGRRIMLRRQLAKRFGPLPAAAAERLAAWPNDRLEQLGEELLVATSLRELGLTDE